MNPYLLLDIALLFIAALVFWQDWQERAVSVWLFVLLFVLAGIRYALAGLGYLPLLFNGLFIFIQLGVLTGYCLLRFRSARLLRYFGLGDVLFWLALALLFSPFNFIAFFVGSLLASLVLYFIIRRIFQNEPMQTVPLAGFQSLLLIFVLAFCQVFPAWQPYEDHYLLSILGLV